MAFSAARIQRLVLNLPFGGGIIVTLQAHLGIRLEQEPVLLGFPIQNAASAIR